MFHCMQTNSNPRTYIEFRVDCIRYSGATEMENTDTIVLVKISATSLYIVQQTVSTVGVRIEVGNSS